MSWFDTKGIASLAKNALKEAQKQIDKALDIQEDQMTNSAISTSSTGVSNVEQNNVKKQPTPIEKKLPGGANREKSKTAPSTPSMEVSNNAILYDTPNSQINANWGSFTGSLFENPKAHEMVTTPPKASSGSLAGPKRQSVTSNSDSVELLSPGSNSAGSELPSPADSPNNNSESVELITAPTTSEIVTPSTDASLPESIVIISSNETCDEDEEEDSVSFNTVMDDTLTAENAENIKNEEQNVNASNNMKLVISLDESQNMDSDSTQSFEDVQMQLSNATLQSCNSTEDSNKSSDKHKFKKYQHSPPNSNDEMETTTSSDIEIISNPNGDSSSQNSGATRSSPLKLKKSQAAHTAATTLNKKGHQREPSEISILSEDSQTELDKLQHRISELNDILEVREQRLLQSERQNAALQERNEELQNVLEALKTNNAGLDLNAEEYTQRLSALEKKFQASIRERDSLRLQVKSLKDELQSKTPKDDLEKIVAENNHMISELRLEGEKLSKEVLQQSNIIKKLRAKEKTTDAQLKKNKEEIQNQNEELERLKKTLNAKDEMESTQIAAIHKISSEKRKLEDETITQRSKIEELQTKLGTLQASFDAVKAELQQRVRLHSDLSRTSEEANNAKRALESTQSENTELQRQVQELRDQLRSTEQQAIKREQQLRGEKQVLMQQLEAAELRAEFSTQEISTTTIPLMRQLESLQNTLSQRTNNWNQQEKVLLEKLDATQSRVKLLEESENKNKNQIDLMQQRCTELEQKLSTAIMQEENTKVELQQLELQYRMQETKLKKQIKELEKDIEEKDNKILQLEDKIKMLEEKQEKESSIVQEMLQKRYSVDSDTLQQELQPRKQRSPSYGESVSVHSFEEGLSSRSVEWPNDDMDALSSSGRMNFSFMGNNASTLEHLQSLLKQREGEITHLQWEQSRLQAERAVLDNEISKLTTEMESLKEKLLCLEDLEQNHLELQTRYDALLLMYGEKVERTEELELDLVELKEAYKVQITELLSNAQRAKT